MWGDGDGAGVWSWKAGGNLDVLDEWVCFWFAEVADSAIQALNGCESGFVEGGKCGGGELL